MSEDPQPSIQNQVLAYIKQDLLWAQGDTLRRRGWREQLTPSSWNTKSLIILPYNLKAYLTTQRGKSSFMCQNLRWFTIWSLSCQMQFQSFVCNIKQNLAFGADKMRTVFILSLGLTEWAKKWSLYQATLERGSPAFKVKSLAPQEAHKSPIYLHLSAARKVGAWTGPGLAAQGTWWRRWGGWFPFPLPWPFLLTHLLPPSATLPPPPPLLFQFPTLIEAKQRFEVLNETILRTISNKAADS